MKKTHWLVLVLMLGLSMATQVRAQDAEPAPAPQQETDDMRPAADEGPQALSGVQEPDVDTGGSRRSFMIPWLRVHQTADSSPRYGISRSTDYNYDFLSRITGSLALQQVSRTSTFTAAYDGGILVSARSRRTRQFHGASLKQEFLGRRSSLVLSNTFRFLPESELGFSGSFGSGVRAPRTGFLRSELRPAQDVITAPSGQFSNAVAAQVGYSLSPRSSLTVSGSYGLLRFLEEGFTEVDNFGYSVGYNRKVSPRNTLSSFYSGQVLHLTGDVNIVGHSVQAAFGRQVTGRMKLELSGGPQINTLNTPIPGFDRTRIGGAGRASLNYVMPRSKVSASYSRGLGGGSGVLRGALTDNVDGRFSTRLTRMWSGGIQGGYRRSSALSNSAERGRLFQAFYTGATLQRPLGRHYDVDLSYRFQRQIANVAGADLNRHTFGLGISWNPRAIRLED